MSEKNPHAVALGRLGGLAGGRLGGLSRSDRKRASSAANGRLSRGRPRLLRVNVYLHGTCIGVSEFAPGTSLEQAKEQLLTENGLDSDIIVRKQARPQPSAKETT